MKKIHIVGAGIAGLWVALLVRKKGYDVTIFEQDSKELTLGCSCRAGGMLAFNCEADSLDDPVTQYGKKSLALWLEFFPEQITQNGSLLLTTHADQDQLRYFEKVTTDYQYMHASDINALEPDLEGRFHHGLYFYNEAHLEPKRCQKVLLETCQDLGIEIQFETPITEFNDNVIYVNTTGLWAKQNLQNLRGVKGEMIVVKSDELCFSRPIRLLHPHHPIYIVPYSGNRYMIGATTIESMHIKMQQNISVHSAGVLLTQAFNVHPAFGEAEIIDMNVGYRPAFENNKPEIVKRENQYYLNGLYRHGWTIAPALAQQLVNELEKNEIIFKEVLDKA